MVGITLICAGKMREKHYISAFDEYAKRLGAYSVFELKEVPEIRLPDSPSQAEIDAALAKEAESIRRLVPKDAFVVAMCVEGKLLSSEQLSAVLDKNMNQGRARFCFLIGGSFGLDAALKCEADLRLSMSPMTFPHHLARVMLAEQVYRAFKIREGSRYHK